MRSCNGMSRCRQSGVWPGALPVVVGVGLPTRLAVKSRSSAALTPAFCNAILISLQRPTPIDDLKLRDGFSI